MEQKPIRDFNNQKFSVAEGAEMFAEFNDRTESSQNGYNSIDELATKTKAVETKAAVNEQAIENLAVGETAKYFPTRADATAYWEAAYDGGAGTAPAETFKFEIGALKEYHVFDASVTPERTTKVGDVVQLSGDIDDENQDSAAKLSVINEVNNKIQGTYYEYRASTRIDSTTGFEGRILANDAENKSYVIPCLPNTTYYFENIVIDLLMQFTTDDPLQGNYIDGTKVSLVTDTVTTDATANFMALNVKVSENPSGFDDFRVTSSNTTAKNKDIENLNSRIDATPIVSIVPIDADRFVNVNYNDNQIEIPNSIIFVDNAKPLVNSFTIPIASGTANSYLIYNSLQNTIEEYTISEFNSKGNHIYYLGFLTKANPSTTQINTRYLKVNDADVSISEIQEDVDTIDLSLNGFKPSYNTVIRYNSDTGFEGSTLPPDADKKSYKIICKPSTTYYLNNIKADILMQFSDESPANANYINGTKVSSVTGTDLITTSAIAKSFVVNIKISDNPDGIDDFIITSSDTKASVRDIEDYDVTNKIVNYRSYKIPSGVEACDGTGEFDAGNITAQEIYDAFDAISELTSEVIGRDQSDTLDIIAYTYNINSTKPKIFIQSGIHGEGTTGDSVEHSISLVYFIRDLFSNYEDENIINLRNNFRFVFVPVANPWGFENDSRPNSRNVDLNRNQPWEWKSGTIYGHSRGTSALSESESIALNNYYNRHTDSFFFIDMHTRGGTEIIANPFFIVRHLPRTNMLLDETVLDVLMNRYNEGGSIQDYTDTTHITGNSGGMCSEYWRYELGVQAFTLEGFNRSATEAYRSKEVVEKNVALLGDYVLNLCLNLKANY